MAAPSIKSHVPGASAGPELRSPSQASHLALVQASSGDERPARTPQDAFCERLRSARERRGISVKAVAETTKVTPSLFEALERGDLSRWPKGIYRRSFFRGYVEAIGLPTDSTLEEFLRLFPDKKPAANTAAGSSPRESTVPASPLRLTLAPETRQVPRRQRAARQSVIDALVVLVVALALIWWTQLNLRTGAVIVALCYYPQLARLVRQRTARPVATRTSVQNTGVQDTDVQDAADELRADAPHVAATATS